MQHAGLPITSKDGDVKSLSWFEETDPAVYSLYREWPKISIITPSFNQGIYLEQTIRSVLMQNYPNLEYIIIDGNSSDNSKEIIKEYSHHLKYWVSEPDSGQTEALDKGFKQATGDIAAWINSDDFYDKHVFFNVAKKYIETGFSFYCGSCCMIDQDDNFVQRLYTKEITYSSLLKYWKPHFCPPQPSLFFKRSLLKDAGGFDYSLRYAMDYNIWVQASKKYNFTVTKDNFSFYRVHVHSKTGSEGGMQKFIPEWKSIIRKSLLKEPAVTRFKFQVEEYSFLLRRKIVRSLRLNS